MAVRKCRRLAACIIVLAAAAAPLVVHGQLAGSVANGIDYFIERVDVENVSGAVAFEVTSSFDTWVAFGLGNPDNGGMVSARTRVIVLADGALSIYGLLGKSQSLSLSNQPLIQTIDPDNLPDGIHSFSWEKFDGYTTLSFTASSIDGESVIKDGDEYFIAAHGADGDNSFKQHPRNNTATITTNLSGGQNVTPPTMAPTSSPTISPSITRSPLLVDTAAPSNSGNDSTTTAPSTNQPSPTIGTPTNHPTSSPVISSTTSSPSQVPTTNAPTGTATVVTVGDTMEIEHELIVLSDGQSVGVRVTVTSNNDAWMGFGLSPVHMVGSSAVIYRPGAPIDNQVKIFKLVSRTANTFKDFESGGDLTDPAVARAAGIDALGFSFVDNIAVMTLDIASLGGVALVSNTQAQNINFVLAHGADSDIGADGGSVHSQRFDQPLSFDALASPSNHTTDSPSLSSTTTTRPSVAPSPLPSYTAAPSVSSANSTVTTSQPTVEDSGFGEYIFVLVVGGLVLLMALVFLLLRRRTGNNYFLFFPVFFHVADIATDLMFALFVMFSVQEELLAVLSIFFIAFPLMLNTFAITRFSHARMRKDALCLRAARSDIFPTKSQGQSDPQSDPSYTGHVTAVSSTSEDQAELRNDVYSTMMEYRAQHKDAYLVCRFLGSISVQLFAISACRFGKTNVFAAPLSLKEQNKLELQGSILNLAESLPQAAIVVSLWQWSPFSVCTLFVTCMSILFTVIKLLSAMETMMVSELLDDVFDVEYKNENEENDANKPTPPSPPPSHDIETTESGVGLMFSEEQHSIHHEGKGDSAVVLPESVEFVPGCSVRIVEGKSVQQSSPQRLSATVPPTNVVPVTLATPDASLV